ncbi:MAG: YebC/PmpR family DNA-binding transcriptional regulator [Armatimonadetes bacterium]|nr:YebC/PmpR family DNA-binding transcriptional regulator [Armatimonadota bacterium]
MAGHSKWKNIRLRKGKQDAIRGKAFTRLSREIIVAARMGGGNVGDNVRLRIAISKAREVSMPADTIEKAIKRGTGELAGEAMEELTYEGYGPGGAAVIVEVTTENRNRTVADLRHAFSKCGGNLAENGSVSWRFKRLAEIIVPKASHDEDEFTLQAIDAGAEEVSTDEESFTVHTAVEGMHKACEALEGAGYKVEEANITYVPSDMAAPAADDLPKIARLLDMLEELDDVKETYVNVDLPEDVFDSA